MSEGRPVGVAPIPSKDALTGAYAPPIYYILRFCVCSFHHNEFGDHSTSTPNSETEMWYQKKIFLLWSGRCWPLEGFQCAQRLVCGRPVVVIRLV